MLCSYMVNACLLFFSQYYDTINQALITVDEESVTNPVILVHAGVYRDESLFMDYCATVLGAGNTAVCFAVV